MLETLRLDGRAAVVTGAGRGLGRAMAKALAGAGAAVVCAARTQSQIDEAAAEIRAAGGSAIAVRADVTAREQVDALVEACLREYGRIDVMVANAGGGQGVDAPPAGGGAREFWEYPDDAFERVLAVNMMSTLYCGRAAGRAMAEGEAGGTIINVSSGTAVRGGEGYAYGTAKAGVIALTKYEASMLWRHGVRANVLVPGFVVAGEPADEQEAEENRRRAQFTPVRRVGEPWELGPLAVFLASDASSYITGQSFIFDGGSLSAGLGPVDFAPLHELRA